MKSIFIFIEPAYYFQSNNGLESHNAKSIRYGTEAISHFGAKLRSLLPEE